MIKRPDVKAKRIRRHKRIRAVVSGTPERPRLSVFRSDNHIYAQIIDDTNSVTLCSASSVEKNFAGSGGNIEAAKKIGTTIAERAIEKGIKNVVFDRGGFRYQGRVAAVAAAARDAGLEF